MILFYKIKDDLIAFFPGNSVTHYKDSGSRRHVESQKEYSRHRRIHRLNDSRINDEKHMLNNKEKKERGNDVMDWSHHRCSDDNDIPVGTSSDKTSRKKKERIQYHTKERVEDNRDSFSKHGLQKSEALSYGK